MTPVEHVAEAAAEHQQAAAGDRVSDDHPRQPAGVRLELGADGRQRDVDHGHVDRDEELQHGQAAENQPRPHGRTKRE
ncbi:hypothetical protein ACIBHY_26600 [Nonomuraea sp. NPDC050547]|uniref:hypothetical protein n=1 Tax=Nonomuraea sp. NPDC050547 TaxID=3364368 RepID=UPI0037B1F1E8